MSKYKQMFISIVIVFALLCPLSIPASALSIIDFSAPFVKYAKVESDISCVSELQEKNLDIITFDKVNFEQIDSDLIHEYLENGTDIYIHCSYDSNVLAEIGVAQCNLTEINPITFLGYYLHYYENGIKASPVIFTCLYDQRDSATKQEYEYDCERIKANYKINPVKLYQSFGSQDEMQMITQSSELAAGLHLQDMTYSNAIVSKLFYDNSVMMYAYAKNYNESWHASLVSDSSYNLIGYAKVHMIMFNNGDAIGRNYDGAFICSMVGAYGNYYVKEYKTTLLGQGLQVFSPQKPPSTSNHTVQSTCSFTFNSNGTASTSVAATVSGNPDGQTFGAISESASIYTITATPASVKRGEEWESVCSAVTAVSQGNLGGLMGYISSLTIKNIATYTWQADANDSVFPGCAALFANHKNLF